MGKKHNSDSNAGRRGRSDSRGSGNSEGFRKNTDRPGNTRDGNDARRGSDFPSRPTFGRPTGGNAAQRCRRFGGESAGRQIWRGRMLAALVVADFNRGMSADRVARFCPPARRRFPRRPSTATITATGPPAPLTATRPAASTTAATVVTAATVTAPMSARPSRISPKPTGPASRIASEGKPAVPRGGARGAQPQVQ